MSDFKTIKRYNAYYHGWCLAFGEHSVDFNEELDINWLYGEERIGLILSSALRKHARRELLGHHVRIPELTLSDDMVKMNEFIHPVKGAAERKNVQRLKGFLLNSPELHMYLCSHLIYPSRTRIITFATKKPVVIMYKEMQPMNLILE